MTFPPRPPVDRDADTQPIPRVVVAERRRAAAVLAVLAVVAVLLTVVMVKVFGSSGKSDITGSGPITPAGPAVTFTGTGAPPNRPSDSNGQTAPATSTHASKSPTSQSSSAPGPSHRHVSCPTSSPCSLPDDIGGAVAAVNSYRAQNGEPPVIGRVSGQARVCALSQGVTCPNNYYWEPVGRSGKQMIEKVLSRGGSGDLLNPSLHKVQVGWAYEPSSHSFWCALIIG